MRREKIEEIKEMIIVLEAFLAKKDVFSMEKHYGTDDWEMIDKEDHDFDFENYSYKSENDIYPISSKDIQWVRSIGRKEIIFKVLCIDSDRIWFWQSLGPTWVLYEDANHWEWSENNKTWLKFYE